MNFVMHRDRVVPTRLGRAYGFEKGVPLHVPPECWADVQAAGAVPEDELPDDSETKSDVPQGPERAKKIQDAIKAMVLRGQRNDFTASGAPNAGVLSANLGFVVDAKERDTVWAAAQNDGE